MSDLSPKQYRAIRLYADAHKLRLTLRQPPFVSFLTPRGDTINVPIKEIIAEYDAELRERAKDRSRQRGRRLRWETR